MRKNELERLDYSAKLWLLVVSLGTIFILGAAALRENVLNDWHRFRVAYAKLLKTKAVDAASQDIAKQFDVGLVQAYLPQLHAVDRCMACHAGVDDPRMIDAPQPFTTHPGRYLEIHDPEKVGCTVCHQGQGRATSTDDAHGRAAHWDYPLLTGEFVQAACTNCHPESDMHGPEGLLRRASATAAIPVGAALLSEGRDLMMSEGCLGCHVVNGKGGTIGPDLSRVGNKTKHGFDFSHLGKEAPHDVPYWLEAHFLDPQAVSPDSLMPAVSGGPRQAKALTAYMLSLRAKRVASSPVLSGKSNDAEVADGEQLYAAYCSACHGADGAGGRVAGLTPPELNNPDTLSTAGDDYYRLVIAGGRSNSDMPAWGQGYGNLSRDEIDRIVAHIRSWEPPGAALGDVDVAAGDPATGRAYYRGMCAGCHGLEGEGGIGTSLRSPGLLSIAADRFLAETIIRGRPGTAMPSWKQLDAGQISDILAYIRQWHASPPPYTEVKMQMLVTPASELERIGKVLFRSNCASCHGSSLEGGIGPSLASPEFLSLVDDLFLYRAIVEGRPTTAMPAWRHLSADDVAALLAYIRSKQTRGARGASIIAASAPPGDYEIGRVHYESVCRSCHGDRASGGVGPQLANPVFLETVSDDVLYQWISEGRTGTAMKGFSPAEQGPARLEVQEIVDVIAYIRHVGSGDVSEGTRSSAGNAAFGAALYSGQCASCHGENGEGATGPQLNNESFLETVSDGFLAATIVLGREGTEMMPMVQGSSGLGQVPPENIPDIIAYMREWQNLAAWTRPKKISETSAQAVKSGAGNYAQYCAGCHGADGLGTREGEGFFAPALNNPEFLRAASDGYLLATIARGRDGTPMRPFGQGAGGIVSLPATDINSIVSFMRSWQQPSDRTKGEASHEER